MAAILPAGGHLRHVDRPGGHVAEAAETARPHCCGKGCSGSALPSLPARTRLPGNPVPAGTLMALAGCFKGGACPEEKEKCLQLAQS